MSTTEHLHLDAHIDPTGKAVRTEQLERVIEAAHSGDLRARSSLAHSFAPLIHTLAEKRAPGNVAQINRLCAVGRDGLGRAIAAYRPKVGASHFRVFALDYIERAMDDNRRGFWRRIFGR